MFYKEGIHAGQSEIEGAMLPHQVHSYITIQILELQVLTIKICIVINRFNYL